MELIFLFVFIIADVIRCLIDENTQSVLIVSIITASAISRVYADVIMSLAIDFKWSMTFLELAPHN